MKNCPYCFEEIRFEAIKCRYCGEMLNKSTSKNILDNAQNLLVNAYNNYKKKKTEHLKLPTTEEGWVIGDTTLYFDCLDVEDLGELNYDAITSISFIAETFKSGFVTTRKISFAVESYFLDDNDQATGETFFLPLFDRGFHSQIYRRKTFETILLMYDHIAKFSFKSRLESYINNLLQKGYFEYMDHKFYKNGHIYDNKNKLIVDLNKVNIVDVYYFFESGPYEFRISNARIKDNSFKSLFQSSDFSIPNYQDKDIFPLLIIDFVKEKSYQKSIDAINLFAY